MGFFSGIGKAISGAVKTVSNTVRSVGRVGRAALPALGAVSSMIPGIGTIAGIGLGAVSSMFGGAAGPQVALPQVQAAVASSPAYGMAYNGPFVNGNPYENRGALGPYSSAGASRDNLLKFGLVGLAIWKLIGKN